MSAEQGHPIVARLCDLVMSPLYGLRHKVVPQAKGKVLEIGAGTGLNFALYGADAQVVSIEPDPHMAKRARARAAELGREVEILEVGAEALPFDDDSFDTVVATWVLCTIPDPKAALTEMRRVLKPGGALRFAEHVRSENAVCGKTQDVLDPAWGFFAGGCHLNRDTMALIREAGFSEVQVTYAPKTQLNLVPNYTGVAIK